MKVELRMSSDLSKEEIRSFLQAIKTWGKQLGDKVAVFTIDVPKLTREETKELLGDVYPMVGEVALPPALRGRRLRFGPRMVVVGDSMLGICGNLEITVTEAADEEIERFEKALEIKLVKIMKG